jgi:hypothetical protein
MSEPDTSKHGPSAITKLRIISSFTLTGSVIAGAFFSWLHTPFDVHAIGACIGTIVGLICVFKSPQD